MASSIKAVFFFVILLNLLTISPHNYSAEQVLHLNSEQEKYKLDLNIDILVDDKNEWFIDDVASPQFENKFVRNTIKSPNFGYDVANRWVRLQLKNESNEKDWYLELAAPPVDYFTVYNPLSSGQFEKTMLGDLIPYKNRPIDHRHHVYHFQVDKGEQKTLYLHFQTEGPMEMPLTLWKSKTFVEKSQNEYLLLGAFIGIIIIMGFYNLFLYFSLRHRSYLLYVMYLFVFLSTQMSFYGLAYQFIWPDAPWWNQRAIIFSMALTHIFVLLFTKNFLQLKTLTPRLNHLLTFLGFTQVGVIIILFFYSYVLALKLIIVSVSVLTILVFLVVIIRLKKRDRPAQLFSIGWLFFLTGAVTSSLVDAGLIPNLFITKYASPIGSTLEVLFFSLALADRINVMRKEKEEAQIEAREHQRISLENLQKADQIKDEFLANTSHELKTPLNGIIGLAESMVNGVAGELNEDAKKNLSLIISSGNRLAHLVNDILDFSQLKSETITLQTKPIQVYEIVDVVLMISRPLLRNKNVKLVNEISPLLPPVEADENRLQQIFHNLIGNAIKFTDEGEIRVTAEVSDGFLQITVADTGIGIPTEKHDIVFLPFEQGDSSINKHYGGTGIGLNISKKLVELHGGRIDVESVVNEGSSFIFTLPISKDKKTLQSSRTLPFLQLEYNDSTEVNEFQYLIHPMKERKQERILIVDDEPINLQVLYNYLILEGYVIEMATTGEEALNRFKDGERFDLVILDIMMPKISGYEVCLQLRKTYSLMDLPIIMLTARNNQEDILMAFEMGANDYLAKPCDRTELLARVRTMLALEMSVRSANERAMDLADLNQNLEEMVALRTKELADVNTHLEKVNENLKRMETSRRHLLSNISHELGTPMTSIQGYVKAFMDGVIPNENQDKYFDIIYSKVQLINRLIQDLFELSKLEARQVTFSFEKVEAVPFFKELYKKYEFDVRVQGIHYAFKLADIIQVKQPLLHVSIDCVRIEQVFNNLIFNALKYTPKDGKIEVRLEFIENLQKFNFENMKKERTVSLGDGQHILIEIFNSGSRIAEEDVAYIFDRFYKVIESETDKKGHGLGLSIAKEIIDYHHGHIWAESIDGLGVSFFFILPITTDIDVD